ncbi:MAG: nitrogenase iron protein NifH [Lachnospiraceae bacterium]|nr:nitrogenase iron protein NifH [Lachnospiraceae bacterium]
MKKIAVYGKGGIGKSTIVSNMAAALALYGYRVLQIGCDPKADSTIALRHGNPLPTVLETFRRKKNDFSAEEIVQIGYAGVVCAEAGGPVPGMGCAGRGIITALEKIEAKGIYEKYQPDIVFYDVLGDVVCGGFSMPMRGGYADKVYIVTSGENMSIYAAANIATAIRNFQDRGYASLGGIILNRRNVKHETEKVSELCEDFQTAIIGTIEFSELVQEAEERKMTLMEAYPDSETAKSYWRLARMILS